MHCESNTTRIHLVRHGETAYNAEKRLQGHTDIPLNDAGKVQAKEAQKKWLEREFTAAYSSDLARAKETLQILLQGQNIAPEEDVRLREQSFGKYEGEVIENVRNLLSKDDPEIEPSQNLIFRMISALEEIAKKHTGGDVLIVSHGGSIRAVLFHLLGLAPETLRTENLGHATFTYTPEGTWTLETMDGIHKR